MERMPSRVFILQRLESERVRQLTHFEGQDAKAGVVLGFSGLLVALRPSGPTLAVAVGTALAALAAVSALFALY